MSETAVPLLIHSLSEFDQIIRTCLAIADPGVVVEVGGEEGTFTWELLKWAEGRGTSVICIDPAPHPRLENLAEEEPKLNLIRQPSIAALDTLGRADVYLIDGDHNYYTVTRELQLIWRAADRSGSSPLVLLHDVGWPWARRDLYYDPEQIPAEHRHEHTWDHGVVVGDPGVVMGGFRGEHQFAVAVREGGPHNGVLTAIEDFLAGRPELRLTLIPSVFGLGVVHDPQSDYAPALEDALAPFADSAFLRRLEDNRLALYLAVLALQDRLAVLEAERLVDEEKKIEFERSLRRLRLS